MKIFFKIKVVFAILFSLNNCSNSNTEQQLPPYSTFRKIKITDIEPQGWIREFIERQRSGLTGNIEVAGYPFNTCMWSCDKMKGSTKAWWPYEQTAYYLDGVHRLGLLLQDESLIEKARKNIQYVQEHLDSSGRISTKLADRWWRWPYANFFRIFMTDYEVNGDKSIVEILHKHYLSFKAEDFADDLELANVEELCWIYGITGDIKMLQMAEKAYELFKSNIEFRNRAGSDIQFASDRIPDHHAVVYLELVKVPAILYSYTGNKDYLDEALNGINKMEKHHMLISGLPSSTEHFSGISDLSGIETCNTAVFPYTYGYFLRVTGDAMLGDRIERAVFNAGIGSVTKDFKAHQYFSSPNQVIATLKSNLYGHNPARMAYAPGHDVECCTGNVNRFMPYYVEQMWLKSQDKGLVSALFGPSSVKALLGKRNVMVTVIEETDYPFSESINFKIETDEPVSFPFYIRIPEWCSTPQILVNDRKVEIEIAKGNFFKLERKFTNGDVITLKIPMEIKITSWPNSTIGIERGPLVYSLPITKNQTIVENYEKSTQEFPAFEMTPKNSWNYGVVNSLNQMVVEHHLIEGFPWDEDHSPISIKVPVKKVNNWVMKKGYDDLLNEETDKMPAIPENPDFNDTIEIKEFVPYGVTTLRLTVFPKIEN